MRSLRGLETNLLIWEDKYFVALNKVAGIVCRPESFPGLYLAHRLDKNTSGVLLLAKSEAYRSKLQALFKTRTIRKVYLGLFFGKVLDRFSVPKNLEAAGLRLVRASGNRGLIEAPMGRVRQGREKFGIVKDGRLSQTSFKVLRYFRYGSEDLTLVEIYPLTGRTHQIRVHFSALRWPLAGDRLYSPFRLNETLPLTRMFLHARSVTFRHPFTGSVMRLEAALSDDLKSFLKLLKKKDLGE